MKQQRRSKLDTLSLVLIAFAASLFLISALSYLAAIILLLLEHGEVPRFSLGDIGNFAGIGGMLIVPLFVVSALTVQWREKRREKKTGQDIDDQTERGTAGRS
jgi:hypothetical protein